MYSSSHNHHGSNTRLLFHRFLCSYRSVVAIFIVFLFLIFLYYYNETLSLLKTRDIEFNQCQQKLDSVSAQLQVVYEHKTRLEKSLTADREACNKKTSEISNNLKKTKDDYDKSQTEVKDLQTQKKDLEKQVADLKAAKQQSDTAVSQASVDAAKAKESSVKELDTIKSENEKLRDKVKQLETAVNISYNHVASLQQQLDQLKYAQQHQQPVSNIQQPNNAAPIGAQQRSVGAAGIQAPVEVPPISNDSAQVPPPNGKVPEANAVNPPRPQRVIAQPHAEQVAMPLAEQQQQQLYAQREVPSQQPQQPVVQAGAPVPVLQHPLGEEQQQLMMARPSNVDGQKTPQNLPPAAQVPQPLQQQAPPPAPAGQSNLVATQKPAAPQDENGGGNDDIEHDERRDLRRRAGDEYRDDDEEVRQRDIDNER